MPDEAAVADVLGILSVRVGIRRIASGRHAESIHRDLPDLCVESLPHLRAAVIHLHAAVAVDQHERSGLIVQRGGEGDAELDGSDGDSAAAIRVRRIERIHLLAARYEPARFLELSPNARDALRILHRLAVVRGLALAVEVALADDVRRQFESRARSGPGCLRSPACPAVRRSRGKRSATSCASCTQTP